jgi:hypothetical protein
MLWEYAPERIVPELRPYHGQASASNWTKAPGMLDYLKQRLAAYPHRGIGEFHIHTLDPSDRDFLKQVAHLAAERQILIHLHSDAKPVQLFYEFEPGLTLIWAHAGMSEPPEVIGPMLDRYPKLYADTSYREHDILGDGTIEPRWRTLIMRYPDRFMVGSDTWVNHRWEHYEALIDLNRRWLSQFPREVAEKIAYRNAETLFGRKVSRQLIGKKINDPRGMARWRRGHERQRPHHTVRTTDLAHAGGAGVHLSGVGISGPDGPRLHGSVQPDL